MKLELVLDEADLPWSPAADWERDLAELIGRWGPAEALLEVVLTDDATLEEHNREYRGVDGPTDVLSFSYLEGHEADREELLAGRADPLDYSGGPHPEDEPLLAGQVLVSVPYVRRRGCENAPDLEGEFAFLAVHGLLHVLGFDHAEEDEAEEMRRHEREIMQDWTSLRKGRVSP